MTYSEVKRGVWRTLEPRTTPKGVGEALQVFLMALIVLNVIAVVLSTVESLAVQYDQLFWAFEVFSVAVFSVEYLSRVWSCTSDQRYSRPLLGRLRYMVTPFALIDLLAILPFFVTHGPDDLRILRMVRLVRITRIFKLGRYSTAMNLMGRVAHKRREQLAVTAALLLMLLIIASAFMYAVEGQAQPDIFGSIPATMWWAVVTLTTVGYGDVYPVTTLGKVLTSIIALIGIGFFALPAGILASGFSEEITATNHETRCPQCGHGFTLTAPSHRSSHGPERRGRTRRRP